MLPRKIHYKLNTDEKEQIVKAERDKRRKIRILQVREISRKNAAVIRNAVKFEKLKQLQKLANNISNEFDKSKQQQLKELEENYENSLRNIGRAHISAFKQMKDENVKEKSKTDNKLKAAYRHNAALERLRDDQVKKYVHENKHIITRKAALEKEKERAAQIASLPKVPPGILEDIQQKVHPVSFRNENINQEEIYYPATAMVKRHHNELVEDGRRAAIIQEEKLNEQLNHAKSLAVEREQVAKIRFKKAINKELLNRDSERVIKELSFLQKKQMKQRQKQLATIPKQVFLPPYKRAEAFQDKQRLMEEEFEHFYVGDQMALKSDLNTLLEPHPPLDSPHKTDSLDITLTSDIESSPVRNIPDQSSSIMKDITNVSLPPTQAKTTKRQTLQTLFDRIKSQRNEWISDMAENLQDAEVQTDRNKTIGSGASSSSTDIPAESEISNSLPEIFSSSEMDERVQGSPLNETSCETTIPVANVVQKMEQIQKHLQQISEVEENYQLDDVDKSEDVKGMVGKDDPASFQSTAIETHLKKQIAEVLEQKKRIQEQKKQLEDRLQQFDECQNKSSLGGYIFLPAEFSKPSIDPTQEDLVHSPSNKISSITGHVEDGTKKAMDDNILNSGFNSVSLSSPDTEMDLQNLDQQSPNYLTREALKRLPKDIAKVQQYQQKIIYQHTERIKRIEEIQKDIQQNRQSLKDSISGISLVTAIPKTVTTDPLVHDPSEQTEILPASSQSHVLQTDFSPTDSIPFLSGVDPKILPNWNPSEDQILNNDLYEPDLLSQKSTDFLSAYQSCIQKSIVGNLFGPDYLRSDFSTDFQEFPTNKKNWPVSSLDDNNQYFQPENLSMETRSSEPSTPNLGTTSKTYSPYAFTPSFNFDPLPTEPIPSSELQEIRKSLPFDETLEDSAQPTPVPSQTVSPHKKPLTSYNGDTIPETQDSEIPDAAVPLPSDNANNQKEFLRIKKQLEEVRKQKEKLCQSLMDNQFEKQTKVLENLGQETEINSSDYVPLVTEQLARPQQKKHPPLLPMAYLYGHSPHELSIIQEKDSSILSSHLSEIHSKLSLSSSVCSSSEPTQTNTDHLISGQLLEEKKLWNILKVLNHENLVDNDDINLSGIKTTSDFLATSTPFLSELKYLGDIAEPAPVITGLTEDPITGSNVEIPQQSPHPISAKTWAEILLENSQQSIEVDSETSRSILQEAPNSIHNSQISLPTSTDTDSTVLRNFGFDVTGTHFIGPRAVSQDIPKKVLALSSSLGSLHCDPRSCETSSDESRLVPHVHTRNSSCSSTQAQDNSESSSLSNSELHSIGSLTKDFLQNHKELSEFISRILQTSQQFHSQTLQPLPEALPSDNAIQTIQNSMSISTPAHFSSIVSLSPSYDHKRDSAFEMYPSTVSDTSGKLMSSALFQVTNTTNQSVIGHGPTLNTSAPSSFDNTVNQSFMGYGPNASVASQNPVDNTADQSFRVLSPNTVNNISHINSTSPADADSKTNSSDASLVSVIPQTSAADNQGMVSLTVNIGKPLKESSPSQIKTTSPLTSQPAYQTNTTLSSNLEKTANFHSDGPSQNKFFLASYPSKDTATYYNTAAVSISQDQIKDKFMHTNAPTSEVSSILPSSTPDLLLKSHPKPLPQLSNISKLSQTPYASSTSHDTTNLSTSISANGISPIHQTISTSSSALTQYSICTTPGPDDINTLHPSSNTLEEKSARQVRNLATSNPEYPLSSYSTVSVSKGTAASSDIKDLAKVTKTLLPSVDTGTASVSISTSSLLLGTGLSTLLQSEPPSNNQVRTEESPMNRSSSPLLSSSCRMQHTAHTQTHMPIKESNQMSSSAISSVSKDTGYLDGSGVTRSLPEIKSAPIAPVIHDQSQSKKSSPISLDNLSLSQYSYTSPETCDDPIQSQSSQIYSDPANPPCDQLSHKLTDIKEKTLESLATQGIGPVPNSKPLEVIPSKWISLTKDIPMNQSCSESETFKYAKSLMPPSNSSHSKKQGSPEIELQIGEKSSTDESSKNGSPSFVSLMYSQNTSSSDSPSDTNAKKVLHIQESLPKNMDADGTNIASPAEVNSLIPTVSSPAELTDSHCSSRITSSADLSGLSGLSQLSLPSDMKEDYQYLIRQARTLVKRCKADLKQEDSDRALASGDSSLFTGMAFTSAQVFLPPEDDHLVKERKFLSSQATNKGNTETTATNLFFDQISAFSKLGISDEPDLSLVSSGNDSPRLKKEGQVDKILMVDDTVSISTSSTRTADNHSENREALPGNPQRLQSDSQSRTRPNRVISNSLAEWKLKYSLSSQAKK